jgi:Phage integrase family
VWNSDNFRADVFAKALKRAAAKAKPARQADFERLEFHDLRHTFASLMIAAGANPLQLAEALGHTDQTGRPDPTLVWKRYGHLYPGWTRAAAAALDRHLKAVALLLARDQRGMRNLCGSRPRTKSLQIETGATGLEPATSGVTGGSWGLRAERG